MRLASACAAVLLLWNLDAAVPAGQAGDPFCDIQTTERVVAVGDVHGAYGPFVSILRAAGLIDGRERWTGGRSILVQTGDLLDRGSDSKRVVDLLRRLEREAERAGGHVYALVGNHEFMRLVGDWRYVSPGEFRAFVNRDSETLRQRVYEVAAERAEQRAAEERRPHDDDAYRERFMRDVPLGYLEMRLAFEASGDYGRWIRSRPAIVRINGIAFLHGGVSEEVAPLGCPGINDAVRAEMASLPVPPEKIPTLLSTREQGPLWYRGLAGEPEAAFASALDRILEAINATAFVIGHTPVLPGRITPRFGGRVIQLDTGMLNADFFPHGVASALELHAGVLTAIYADRRERIEAPALARPNASAPHP